jgi:ubiquinone biosynthesis protein|tara:strand:- start:278 stop:1822 length:1545 start_codon:yes stop_codon:yes gene_type:complete
MPFIKLIRIVFIFLKFKLNEIFPKEVLPLWLKVIFFLSPFNLIPTNKKIGVRLAEALETAGPIFVKFGQLLSTRPDFLDEEIIQELQRFQNNLKPFSSKEAMEIIEKDLGRPINELFADFNSLPLAAASIAQVHEATLKSGEEVVVKVVRPNLEKKIKDDISILKMLGKVANTFDADARRLQLLEMIREYEYVIKSEVDLKKEAGNTIQTAKFFEDSNLLYIPKVYLEYSASKTLTLEKIKGIPVTDIKTLEEKEVDLKKLSERGVSIFFKQLFDDNFFHADMHPGNIFVNAENPKDPTYIAVDYAICGSLSEKEQLLIGKMLADMFSRNYAGVAKTMINAGWVSSSTKPIELEVTIRTAIDPIFERPFSEINFGEMLLFLFEETRSYELSLPASLLLLHKTLINIEGLGRQIYPDLDLWTTAKPFIQNWVSKRYNPKNLLEQLKNNTGDFAEKAYELPEKLETIFNNLANLNEFNNEIKNLRKDISSQKQNSKFMLISSTAVVIAIISTIIFL